MIELISRVIALTHAEVLTVVIFQIGKLGDGNFVTLLLKGVLYSRGL